MNSRYAQPQRNVLGVRPVVSRLEEYGTVATTATTHATTAVAASIATPRYEEMRREPRDHVRRIAEFIGAGTPAARVDEVLEATSVERLRATERRWWPRLLRWLGLRNDFRVRSAGEGRGRQGGLLSHAQRAALEREYERVLRPIGVPRTWVLGGAENSVKGGVRSGGGLPLGGCACPLP